jgi:hypothetical protein
MNAATIHSQAAIVVGATNARDGIHHSTVRAA